MLPSLLIRDIQQGLKQFLVTGFDPSDDFFRGLMARLVENGPAWMKGPYLQIGLPFRVGAAGRGFFTDFQTEHPGYTHQEAAWQRLSSQHLGTHTLVATGTGSGKTECFLYPLLDHAARARRNQESGIKALVIYPMNALASDQARRFAEVIHSMPAFKGLRVGLFVGGARHQPGDGLTMTTHSVITDHDTLRKAPPDILLTNYKMLDYLLIRPRDRVLWAKYGPETLRYVVVDELHTFDGAQGTDLALLLRRLKVRLESPPDHLIYVGTSATLGGTTDSTPLRDYAGHVFNADFPPESVISENRLAVAEFLGDAVIDHLFQARADVPEVLDPNRYPDQAAAVAAWFAVFFPDLPQPADVRNGPWRQELGQRLKSHLLFVNLLRLARTEVIDLPAAQEQLQGTLPESMRPHTGAVLNALLVLVAWARSPDSVSRPLTTLRLQLWLRELRRMVAKVSPDSALVALRHSADIKAKPEGLHLPLVQCTQCHTTAWLSRLPHNATKLSQLLEEIYNTWFGGAADAVRLYPGKLGSRPQVEGLPVLLCGECGTVQASGTECSGCGSDALVRVFRTTGVRTSVRRGVAYAWHDDTCPSCGERNRLILLGARNATLGAQVIEHIWASPFNDDKKLIAFSDSVQDAAHRAGFFNARTYTRSIRTALAKAVDELVPSSLPWSEFLERFARLRHTAGSALAMQLERFVAEFIGPNMVWQRDWAEELLKEKGLPEKSRLPERVAKRLAWQVQAEMTYLSRRGRTLERIGKAVICPDLGRVDRARDTLLPLLREKFDARGVDRAVLFHWLWGFLTHLRQRGALWHAELERYAEDGNIWSLARSQGRGEWLPNLGDRGPRPVFLSLGQHRGFDTLASTRLTTWYVTWLEATLGQQMLLPQGAIEPMYREALRALESAGLVRISSGSLGESVALNPETQILETEVCYLQSLDDSRRLTVPRTFADRLLGMPCLDAPGLTYEKKGDFQTGLPEYLSRSDLRRVISAEHTGLLERDEREQLERRFKAKQPQPWYENLLSATPTLEMGVDIGDLSSVLLCSVPPNQASFLQRIGRAGRRDGNAVAITLADGGSPHDLYFFEATQEMLAGEVLPPGVFLQAVEVLRRQLLAFCLDDWVASGLPDKALPDKTSPALDAVENHDTHRFPYTFLEHLLVHEPTLLPGFIGLLGTEIDPEIESRLRLFYQGGDDVDSLRVRLLKIFEELSLERNTLKTRAKQIKAHIKSLSAQPQDEATRHEIDQLDRERQSVLALIKEINQRDLLNTLTDAGLIPNYAFPEAGISLKSILWRRKSSDDVTDRAYVALPALKYERPAASALSEFAPENRFYANQRRVEVDQINMDLAKLESWRLCPSCHHMQNLELVADTHLACPHCGDVMWANISQKHQLLRFRQAIANSDDTQVRIDDSADEREPKFYVRQLMVDFEAKDIREAWRVKADDLPFGFEFIATAAFRDVNFGELGKPGANFKVADRESIRPGFKLCRRCGKVQTPQRQRDPEEAPSQQHAFDCDKRGSDDPGNLVDCLYLYREFHSEALRILVPYTKSGMDDEVIQSFTAALQLGLKRRFGGKVDHLRIVTQDEPAPNGGPRRVYVLLYDSVPGGTGYLHQLLSHDAQTLADVLRLAHDALTTCKCNGDPEKDGCYQCVYQYRLGRMMEKISRSRAAAVLGELLGALDNLEKVSSISEIYINPNFDSALEARFIECLPGLSGANGLAQARLVQDIVNGKTGYLLEVGDQRYWIEPQTECPASEGFAFGSQPDFVLWPAQSNSKRRPIAVFCDGWTYHREILADDARKRNALVASGRFWVWAITHSDVLAALAGETRTDLESPLTRMNRHSVPMPVQADPAFFGLHAVSQLLYILALPADKAEAFLLRNATVLTARMIHHPTDPNGGAALNGAMTAFWGAHLPDWMHDFAEKSVWASSRDGAHPALHMQWPYSLAKGQDEDTLCPGVVLLDESKAEDADALLLLWRYWLALFNVTQFLPGLLMTTARGLVKEDHEGLQPASVAAPGNVATVEQGQAWAAVIDQAMELIRDGLIDLSAAGVAAPDEVGFELAPDGKNVTAEAELAWLSPKIVLLLEHQYEYQPEWEKQGWKVLLADEGWVESLTSALTGPQEKNS